MNEEYNLFCRLYRAWINPNVRAMNINECDDACHEKFIYVEQCLIETGHLHKLYPNIYGCPVHGNYRVISLNHPRTRMYVAKWKTLMSARRVIVTPCNPSCTLINIPKQFYETNEIILYYKPAFFCPIHGAVHFCSSNTARCNRCECCLRREMCPFQCYEHKQHGVCHITGQIFDVNIADGGHTSEEIERSYRSEHQHTYFRSIGSQLIEHTKERIHQNTIEWIKIAQADRTPLTQSPETLFAKMMKMHCYICTDVVNGKRVDYFFHPSIEIVRYIHYVCTLNSVPFVGHENLDKLLFELWSLLFFHVNQILGWEYIITLVAHLSAENGLQLRDMRLTLKERYVYLLYRLRHTSPPHKSKKTNVLMKSQMFSNILYELPYATQHEICSELQKRKFELFAA